MIVRETTSPPYLADETLPVIAWLNYALSGFVSASNDDDNFPVNNLTNPATHLKWREALLSPSIEESLGMIVPYDPTTSPVTLLTVDYVAIARHNFGSLGCTLTLEGTNDVTSPVTGFTQILQFTPTDDSPIIMQFEPRQLAFMRLLMSASPGGAREAAVLYFGQILTLERGVKADTAHGPINLGRNTSVFSGFSESGNFLGRIVRNTVNESKAEFMHFTQDWYRANFDPFIINSQTHPFFWAWDPDANPGDVGFSWLTKSAIPEINPATQRFNVTLEMRAVA